MNNLISSRTCSRIRGFAATAALCIGLAAAAMAAGSTSATAANASKVVNACLTKLNLLPDTQEKARECLGSYADECAAGVSDALPPMQQIEKRSACYSAEEKAWISTARRPVKYLDRIIDPPSAVAKLRHAYDAIGPYADDRCAVFGDTGLFGATGSVDLAECHMKVTADGIIWLMTVITPLSYR